MHYRPLDLVSDMVSIPRRNNTAHLFGLYDFTVICRLAESKISQGYAVLMPKIAGYLWLCTQCVAHKPKRAGDT